MRARIYLDTSVFGAICDPELEERLVATRRLLDGLGRARWEGGSPLSCAGAMPANSEDDARHIAIAAVNGIHTVVSWNFRHMVNVERRRRINAVNLREGLPFLDIMSPWEIIDEEA